MAAIIVPKGATVTHEWYYPFEAEDTKWLTVTYKQNGITIIQKTKADCEFTTDEDGEPIIRFELKSNETNRFKRGVEIEAQIRAELTNGADTHNDVVILETDKLLDKRATHDI